MNLLFVRRSVALLSVFFPCTMLLMSVYMAAGKDKQEILITDKLGRPVGSYKASYALVIGVSDYTGGWPALPGVKEDLRLITQTLEKNGFYVVMVENPDQAALEKAYTDFILTYGLDPDNRLLFYFAGHGYTHKPSYATENPKEWQGYIISRDAPLPMKAFAAFRRHALSMERFVGIARDIEAKHALFLFDSCFSGTIFVLSRAVPREITEQSLKPVRQFISSGGPDQEVPDTSEFRRQFVTALEGEADSDQDGYVTGSELGQFLQDRVTTYSQGAQTPQYGKIRDPLLDRGDFVFPVHLAALPANKQTSLLPKTIPDDSPPPPLALQGHLQVNVNVAAAQVSINGQLAGVARRNVPLHLRDLEAGVARVRVEAEGYEPVERAVKIGVGEWTQEAFLLQPSQVRADPSESPLALSSTPSRPFPAPVPAPSSLANRVTEGRTGEEALKHEVEEERRRAEKTRLEEEHRREKENLTRRAEEAKRQGKWLEAEELYELALGADPYDETLMAALSEAKEARWKTQEASTSAAPQLVMFTPHQTRLSLFAHQSRLFGIQVMVPGTVDPPLHYTWRLDGQSVPGQEVFEFKDQSIGTHEVSLMVMAPSGARLTQHWIVEVRERPKGDESNPIWSPYVEVFDVSDPIVTATQKQLTVSGKVRNIDKRNADNVVVWVTALDENNQPVLRRLGLPSPQPLAPDGVAAFQVSMANMPAITRFRIQVVSK